MENKANFIDPLIEKIEAYGKTTYELYKLKTVDKLANNVSGVATHGIICIVLFFALILLSAGVAFWLGEVLNKLYYGFFCVAGFYFVVGIVLYFVFFDSIKKNINNSIISQILN